MPEIKEAALLSLQEAFQEVAFRANRLREWMTLDLCLRSLERRFSDFDNEVQKVVGPPLDLTAGTEARLKHMWNRCRDTELVDLQTFAEGVRYINRSTWNEQGNGSAPQPGALAMRVVNISSLNQLIDPLEKAVTERLFGDLLTRCALFRKTLNGQIADRQHIVNSEVQELCELTIRLRMQLQT
jgi:hypothetical protein